jgi:hypothetical protein
MIRQIYSETLEGYDGFDAMTVCYSHPKNLRDLLCSTVTEQPPGEKMSEILEELPTNPNINLMADLAAHPRLFPKKHISWVLKYATDQDTAANSSSSS